MYGVLNENKIGISRKEGVSLHKNIIILNEGAGFYRTEKVLKLYNTITDLLSDSNINEDILNKFIEINHCMNVINYLKVDNYSNFIEDIEDYYEAHEGLDSMWDNPIIDRKNVFQCNIFDIEMLNEQDFIQSIDSAEVSELNNKIYGNESEYGLKVFIPKDTRNKYARNLYLFAQNNSNDLKRDIAYSFRNFTEQVSKLNFSYAKELSLLDMTNLGLNIEHVNAINTLLASYNYLINSKSFEDNQLLFFDEDYINKKISTAKLIVERIPYMISARLDSGR